MTMKSNTHPDDQLAWYVNGTLAGTEQQAVAAHVRECARCRDEIEFLKTLRQGIKMQTADASPGDLGLKRLLRDVKAQPARTRSWWQPALAAAAVVIVV